MRTGFARSNLAGLYALVQDAPGGPTTAGAIHSMDRWDLLLTAKIRERFYRMRKEGAEQGQHGKGP